MFCYGFSTTDHSDQWSPNWFRRFLLTATRWQLLMSFRVRPLGADMLLAGEATRQSWLLGNHLTETKMLPLCGCHLVRGCGTVSVCYSELQLFAGIINAKIYCETAHEKTLSKSCCKVCFCSFYSASCSGNFCVISTPGVAVADCFCLVEFQEMWAFAKVTSPLGLCVNSWWIIDQEGLAGLCATFCQ